MEVLNNSRMKAERACSRLHELEYDLGFVPTTEPDATRFGTLFHGGLEAWFLAAKAGRGSDLWLSAAIEALTPDADPFDRVRAEEMLRGYHLRWAGEPYQVLEVEVRFETDLINPATGAKSKLWRLGGTIDALVADTRDGRVLIVEHKTSAEDITPGSEYWRRLRMDGQVSTYHEGAKALGYEPAGCLYDVIGKPTMKPLKATPPEQRKYTKATRTEPSRLYANQREQDETPEEFRARLVEDIAANPSAYYQRAEVVRLESEMLEWKYDVWRIAQRIRENQRAGFAPRNPDACVRYGRTCSYFGVCTGEASLDDPALFVRRSKAVAVQPAESSKEESQWQPQPSP